MTVRGKKIFSGTISAILKILVAAGVIIWLCRSFDFNILAGLAAFDYKILIPVFLLSALSAAVASERWRVMANLIDIKLSRLKAFSLTMQGMFFSLVIPGGAIGGDMVKMAATANHVRRGTRTEGIVSIVMDRIAGMIALFILSLILLIISKGLFKELHIDGTPAGFTGIVLWWLLTGVSAAGLLAALTIFLHRKIENLPLIKNLLAFADRKSGGKITRISAAADAYASRGGEIGLWTILTIFLVHLTPAAAMLLLLSGTGAEVQILPAITAVVIGNIAGLIPLFPGGIGARDAVTIALLTTAGYTPESAATAQLLATAILVVFNLTGSLFFIFDRKRTEVHT